MAKHPQFDEQLRRAIDASGMSRRFIAKSTGIDEGNFSKFMAGISGLSIETINKICELLGLKLVAPEKPAGKVAKGKRAKK